MFEGTFSGTVSERYFGGSEAWALDASDDPIPGFSADALTGTELGLDEWPGFFDPGKVFTARISLVEDATSLHCAITGYGGQDHFCSGQVQDVVLDQDPLSGQVTAFSASIFGGASLGSRIELSDAGGRLTYEDDAVYKGPLARGGSWQTDWGVRLVLDFSPVARTGAGPLLTSGILPGTSIGLPGAVRRQPAR